MLRTSLETHRFPIDKRNRLLDWYTNVIDWCESHWGIEAIYLVGSLARGDFCVSNVRQWIPQSDIDLLVVTRGVINSHEVVWETEKFASELFPEAPLFHIGLKLRSCDELNRFSALYYQDLVQYGTLIHGADCRNRMSKLVPRVTEIAMWRLWYIVLYTPSWISIRDQQEDDVDCLRFHFTVAKYYENLASLYQAGIDIGTVFDSQDAADMHSIVKRLRLYRRTPSWSTMPLATVDIPDAIRGLVGVMESTDNGTLDKSLCEAVARGAKSVVDWLHGGSGEPIAECQKEISRQLLHVYPQEERDHAAHYHRVLKLSCSSENLSVPFIHPACQ